MLHGTQLYGRVDTAGGDFFVATEFFHLFFLPLVPLRSWLVIGGAPGLMEREPFRGYRLPLRLKSIFTAYVRVACTGVLVWQLALVFGPTPPLWLFGAAPLAVAVLGATYWSGRTTRDDALALAARAGAPADVVAMIEQYFSPLKG